jgi:hypothetical protein
MMENALPLCAQAATFTAQNKPLLFNFTLFLNLPDCISCGSGMKFTSSANVSRSLKASSPYL